MCLLPLIVPWTTVPDARPPLTETVKVVVPLAGTVTKAGKLIRLSPDVVVSASNAMSVALVLGVNFNAANENVWSAPVVFDNVKLKKLTLPKLAESGSKKTVAFAALVRFSRPAPWAVGPTSFVPVFASLMTRSEVLTSADLTWSGDQPGCSWSSTAADPAKCGVAIDVPLKKAQPEPSPGQPAPFPTQVIELSTLTPTDVASGLMSRSGLVGPWLLKPASRSASSSKCFPIVRADRSRCAKQLLSQDLGFRGPRKFRKESDDLQREIFRSQAEISFLVLHSLGG